MSASTTEEPTERQVGVRTRAVAFTQQELGMAVMSGLPLTQNDIQIFMLHAVMVADALTPAEGELPPVDTWVALAEASVDQTIATISQRARNGMPRTLADAFRRQARELALFLGGTEPRDESSFS